MTKEEKVVYRHKYYLNNFGKEKTIAQKWKETHKEQVATCRKEYNEKNKVQIAERTAKYYQNNKEIIKQKQKKYNEKNRERFRSQRAECAKRWYTENKERQQEYNRNQRKKEREREDPEAKEKRKINQRKYRKEQRMEVIKYYGGKCECCGEDRYEFLAIDHINGGGTKLRKESKMQFMAEIIKNNYPNIYRVLCHNCNMSLGAYGYCPHNKDFKEVAI